MLEGGSKGAPINSGRIERASQVVRAMQDQIADRTLGATVSYRSRRLKKGSVQVLFRLRRVISTVSAIKSNARSGRFGAGYLHGRRSVKDRPGETLRAGPPDTNQVPYDEHETDPERSGVAQIFQPASMCGDECVFRLDCPRPKNEDRAQSPVLTASYR